MKTHPDKLAAKIAAKNRVNQLAIDTVPKMVAALQPFIGKKVLNQGCILAKAVRDALPRDNCAGKGASADQWHYSPGTYNIYVEFEVQECSKATEEWRGEDWARQTTMARIGEIKDGILIASSCDQTWRTDYNREEVEKNRFAYEAARKAMEEAESNLCGFGVYDR